MQTGEPVLSEGVAGSSGSTSLVSDHLRDRVPRQQAGALERFQGGQPFRRVHVDGERSFSLLRSLRSLQIALWAALCALQRFFDPCVGLSVFVAVNTPDRGC